MIYVFFLIFSCGFARPWADERYNRFYLSQFGFVQAPDLEAVIQAASVESGSTGEGVSSLLDRVLKMPQSWDAKYFDGKSPQSMLVRLKLLPKGVMLHFMDGRSQHWKHESFSIVRDRESSPIRLLRGDYPQETVEIPDQGFASVLEQKGLSGNCLLYTSPSPRDCQ